MPKVNSYLLVSGLKTMYQDEERNGSSNGYPMSDAFYEAMDLRLGFKENKEVEDART